MPQPRAETPFAHRSSPRGQAWGTTLTHAYRPIPDKMTSFLDTILSQVRKPLGSNQTYTMDPDDEQRARSRAMAKLSTTLERLCCFTCNKVNPRVEMSADDSGYACLGCGEVLRANVKSEPRANYDNDPALEQAEHVPVMVDV